MQFTISFKMKVRLFVASLAKVATLACLTRLCFCNNEKEFQLHSSLSTSFERTSIEVEDDRRVSEAAYNPGQNVRTFSTETRQSPQAHQENSYSSSESGDLVHEKTDLSTTRNQFPLKEFPGFNESGRLHWINKEDKQSTPHEDMFKYFIENHLITLTPCSSYKQRPLNGSDWKVTQNITQSYGYCTSATACLGHVVSYWPQRDQSALATLQQFVNKGSALLRPTCLYLHEGVLHNGVCCKSRASNDQPKEETTLLNKSQIFSIEDEENGTYRQPSVVPSVRRPLIDRGHIFSRPSSNSYDKEGRKKDGFTQNIMNFRPIVNPNNHFSVSYITHPPAITNKPWWIKQSTESPKTIRTTRRKWWWASTTAKPTTTSRPTTRKTTRWWKPSKNNNKKWPMKSIVSGYQTTTKRPLRNQDFCSPSAFKDAASEFDPDYELSSQRITGGRPLTPNIFPWLVMIMRGRKHVCGGSLIDDRHILTAAHCVATLTSSQLSRLSVLLGSHNIGRDEPTRREYTIKTVVRHKDYSRKLLRNDLAVITLNQSVEFTPEIRPICLFSDQDLLLGEYATVAGWGSLYEGGYQVYTPRVVDLRIWGNEECSATYGRAAPGGIVDSYLCAGKRGKDACSGDSGGPLVKKIGGVWKQVGVVSWGIGCGKGSYPGVYSRMSHFYPWIQRVLTRF